MLKKEKQIINSYTRKRKRLIIFSQTLNSPSLGLYRKVFTYLELATLNTKFLHILVLKRADFPDKRESIFKNNSGYVFFNRINILHHIVHHLSAISESQAGSIFLWLNSSISKPGSWLKTDPSGFFCSLHLCLLLSFSFYLQISLVSRKGHVRTSLVVIGHMEISPRDKGKNDLIFEL